MAEGRDRRRRVGGIATRERPELPDLLQAGIDLAARATLVGIDIDPILRSGDPIELDAYERVIEEAEDRKETFDHNLAVMIGVEVANGLGGNARVQKKSEERDD